MSAAAATPQTDTRQRVDTEGGVRPISNDVLADAYTLDAAERDVAADLAERLEGCVSRLVLHVHTGMPADQAGRTIFGLVSAKVHQVPGLVSTRWQVTDGRRVARTGLLTVTVAMPVRLSAYAATVVGSHAQELDLSQMESVQPGQVLDLTRMEWAAAPQPEDLEKEALVVAAHAAALEHTTRLMSPVLVDPRITGWHLTGSIEE